MSDGLDAERLVPFRRDTQPMSLEEARAALAGLTGWSLELEAEGARLVRVYTFRNFRDALAWTNAVGALGESAGHHPALLTEWGAVTVTWWSAEIGGLQRNDFILAARTDQLDASSALSS